jgi:hypothetical protein
MRCSVHTWSYEEEGKSKKHTAQRYEVELLFSSQITTTLLLHPGLCGLLCFSSMKHGFFRHMIQKEMISGATQQCNSHSLTMSRLLIVIGIAISLVVRCNECCCHLHPSISPQRTLQPRQEERFRQHGRFTIPTRRLQSGSLHLTFRKEKL